MPPGAVLSLASSFGVIVAVLSLASSFGVIVAVHWFLLLSGPVLDTEEGYLFIYLLKAYSPVNRIGSPQGFPEEGNML